MVARYFLGAQLLGTSPRQAMWSDTTFLHSNEALFCPTCGEVWGRVVLDGCNQWSPTIRGCLKHPFLSDVGGSFIASWRRGFAELPPEVLAYEIQIRTINIPE